MAKISFNDISFTYEGSEAETIKGFQLAIEDGEILSIFGKSGSGKTTLLKIMAGLLSPQKGRLCFDNEDVTQLTAKKRDIAQVFQFPVLYDSMNVEDNVKFPLRIKKLPEIEVQERFERVCSLLELDPILKSKSKDLSLYQRQIVSIARAFVRPNLKAVFLDEPLTALSPKLKWQLRKKIKTLQREDRVTMVFVTHDQTEAMTLGQRLCVLNLGKVMQVGVPMDLYQRPVHKFVGDFIGTPGMNFIRGKIQEVEGGMIFIEQVKEGDETTINLPEHVVKDVSKFKGSDIFLGVRPEHLKLIENGVGLKARLETVETLGHESLFHVCTTVNRLIVRSTGNNQSNINGKILAIDWDNVIWFDSNSGKALN